jgi:branched-chain amino acid transport system permease protein
MEISSGAAIILCIVVLDNIGWIIRLITGALILLPDYLRACVDYRRLVFGAVLVAKLAFRPQGLVAGGRRTYTLRH